MTHKFVFKSVIAFVVCLCLPSALTYAAEPYPSYCVTESNSVISVPLPYLPSEYFLSFGDKNEKLLTPQDLYIDEKDNLYIADTGNNRIIILDKNYKLTAIIGEGILNSPEGICVVDDAIYVADSGNSRIAIFNKDGKLSKEIKKPDSELLVDQDQFVPTKLVVDSRGYMYVACEGNENGLYMIDLQGNFRGFFGANKTEMNLVDTLVRFFYSKQQRQGQVVKLPYSYVNVGTRDGYIYASTTGATTNQIRRLSPSGGDVLFGGKSKDFSDNSFQKIKRQNFVDFAVDGYGNLTVLDQSYGKIYQYDKEGKMLFAFGDNGINKGCFLNAVSIVVNSKDELLVLDSDRGCVQVYNPTVFTRNIHIANNLYSQGKYDDAKQYWQKTLAVNSQYDIAQQALGRIEFRKQNYVEALHYALLSNDKNGYTLAFTQNRAEFVSKYFNVITPIVVILFILTAYLRKKRKKKSIHTSNFSSKNLFDKCVYSMLHPFDMFSEFKYNQLAKYRDMFILLGAYTLVNILSVFIKSFLYRSSPIEETDWISVIGFSIVPWALLCLANYGFTTLADGKGKFKEVMVGGAFCLSPLILFGIPVALLTNVLSLEESGFLSILIYISYFLTVFMAFVFQQEVHNYTMGKSIIVLILTALGAVIIACLIVIAFGLFGQLVDFVNQIFREVSILVS